MHVQNCCFGYYVTYWLFDVLVAVVVVVVVVVAITP